jgi:hypothetical protein
MEKRNEEKEAPLKECFQSRDKNLIFLLSKFNKTPSFISKYLLFTGKSP